MRTGALNAKDGLITRTLTSGNPADPFDLGGGASSFNVTGVELSVYADGLAAPLAAGNTVALIVGECDTANGTFTEQGSAATFTAAGGEKSFDLRYRLPSTSKRFVRVTATVTGATLAAGELQAALVT